MAYEVRISRPNPGCFVFLLDQSGSMADEWGGESGKRKADVVATIINRLLSDLVLSCTMGEDVYDRFRISVIGYSGSVAGPVLGGPLSGRELVWVSEVWANPLRVEERRQQVEDGIGGTVERTARFPVWFDPKAESSTPMCAALSQAKAIVQQFASDHPASFPPVVINITDGEATDGNPMDQAESIRSVSTADGNVLLFNAHVSSGRGAGTVLFPTTEDLLSEGFARMLYRMSSTLPDSMVRLAEPAKVGVEPGARGFVYNAQAVDLIKFLRIGTDPALAR